MKGNVSVKVGEYKVEAHVWFDVRLNDQGTRLSLCNKQTNRRHTVIIDENGHVAEREIGPLVRWKDHAAPPPDVSQRASVEGIIELPEFARDTLLAKQVCPYCHASFQAGDVSGMGIRRHADGQPYFWFLTSCRQCQMESSTMMTARPMGTHELFEALRSNCESVEPTPSRVTAEASPALSLSSSPYPPPARPSKWRKTETKATRIKFIVQYGRYYRPRNVFFVIGGYMCDDLWLVLYRVMNGGAGALDGIVQIIGDNVILPKHVPERLILPDERWELFMALPAGASFHLDNREWVKLSRAQLEHLHGRKFRVKRPE